MPELPEVETSRRGIEPYLSQQIIQDVIIRQTRLRWPIPSKFKESIIKQKIKSVKRRGKYLLLCLANGIVLLHLGMSGSLRIVPATSTAKKHDHVDIILESGQCLRFHDPRRFGAILWVTQAIATYPLFAKLGPEPLSVIFNARYLYQKMQKRRIPIKPLIMDNQIVVGVGNIYATEALFKAGIHPERSSQQITYLECVTLVKKIKQILRSAIQQGGTTLRDFVNSQGKPGYFQQRLLVYGRTGLKCYVCDNILVSLRLRQRASTFCPTCQN